MNKSTFTFAAVIDAAAQKSDNLIHFSGVAYSGGLIPDYGCYGDIAIDLANASIRNGGKVTVLFEHDREKAIGSAYLEKVNGQILLKSCTVSAETKEGQRIKATLDAGTDWMFSIGMVGGGYVYSEEKTQTNVNGQTLMLDGVVVGEVDIYELSLVTFGADPQAKAQFNFSQKGTENMAATAQEIADIEARVTLQLKAQQDKLAADNEVLKTQLSAMKEQAEAVTKARGEALALEFGKTIADGHIFAAMTAEQVAIMRELSKKPKANTGGSFEFAETTPATTTQQTEETKAFSAYMKMSANSLAQYKAMGGNV